MLPGVTNTPKVFHFLCAQVSVEDVAMFIFLALLRISKRTLLIFRLVLVVVSYIHKLHVLVNII